MSHAARKRRQRRSKGGAARVVLVLFAVVASRDPSFAVEPDYYRKSLEWDATAAQARASKPLPTQVSRISLLALISLL